MKIILGHELDTGGYPDALGDAEATVGNVVVGPSGLVGILETRLGLTKVRPHGAVRIGHLLRILKDNDNGRRFYSKSLEADAWSTAKTILTWRDELKISGWNGDAPSGASDRLKTLSDLEKVFQKELIEGMGDRLQAILLRLNRHQELDINRILLVEPMTSWASGWRKLLDSLSKCGVAFSDAPPHIEPSAGDLGRLQQALRTGMPILDTVEGDGSLCVVRSQGEWESCETIASFLEAIHKSENKTLIINGGGSHLLDDTLNRHNLPRLGYDSRSRWRTSLQLLPLVLGNYWKPLDAQKLLEFLIMPKSPVSRDIGVFLEQALREHPGIGGPKWDEAIKSALKQYDTYSSEGDLELGAGESREDFRKELSFWLGEDERFSPDDGMPSSVVREICSRLNKWAAKRGGKDNDITLIASAKLFSDVSEAIQDCGLTKITQPQLNRILDSVIGEGLEKPDYGPQAAPWSWVDSPGQIWGTADTIIWWNFCSEGVSPLHSTWTSLERESLKTLGVELRETHEMRLQQSSSWRNAVTFAGKRLALVSPMSIAGKTLNYHPFWDEVRHLLNLEEASIQKLTFEGAQMWREEHPGFFGLELTRKPVSSVETPKPGQVWLVPPNRIKGRIEESYSSIQTLIDCPVAWVCQYVLQLHPGTLALLPDRGEMLGTLSHAVMEKTLCVKPLPHPKSAEQLAKKHFDELVPQMAASLLFPERKSELERVRGLMGSAARILAEHIHSSGLSVRSHEHSVRKELNIDQKMSGIIDMSLGDDTGDKVVLDLKWSRQARYKREELEKGGAFQLAVYSWLLRNQIGDFPAGAYYMLAQGELIASACNSFPAECIFPDVDMKKTWDEGMELYKARISELQNGQALASGIPPDNGSAQQGEEPKEDDSSGPSSDPSPKCKWCSYSSLCGMGVS
jgi:ATP-dependent helicase/nuclease subunit B